MTLSNFTLSSLSWYFIQTISSLLLHRNFGDQKLFTYKRMQLNGLQFVNEDMYKSNFNSSFLFVFCLSCVWTPKDKHNTYPCYTKTTQSLYKYLQIYIYVCLYCDKKLNNYRYSSVQLLNYSWNSRLQFQTSRDCMSVFFPKLRLLSMAFCLIFFHYQPCYSYLILQYTNLNS